MSVQAKKLDGSGLQTWPQVVFPSFNPEDRMERRPNVVQKRRNDVFMAEILSGTNGDTEIFTLKMKKVSVSDWKVKVRDFLTRIRVFQFSPDSGSTWLKVHVKNHDVDNTHGPYVTVDVVLEVIE